MPVAQYKYMYLYSYLQACVACSMAHVRLSFPANRSNRAFSWKVGRLWIGFDVIHLCKLKTVNMHANLRPEFNIRRPWGHMKRANEATVQRPQGNALAPLNNVLLLPGCPRAA
jgi:hypothetical protein